MTGKDALHTTPVCEVSPSQTGVRPWLKLLFGLALILAFIFGFGNAARWIPGARQLAQVVAENDLRPSAIYYTDYEASAEGSERIRDSLDYTPAGRP